MADKSKNPVVAIMFGVEIRRYNYISVMFPAQQYAEYLQQANDTGLSIAKLMAIKSQPCQQCKCDNVTLVVKKDGRINKQDTSQNIIERNAKRQPDSN